MNIINLDQYRDTLQLFFNIINASRDKDTIRLLSQLEDATNNIYVSTRLIIWDSNYQQVSFKGTMDNVSILRINGILVGYYKDSFIDAIRHKLIDVLIEEQASDEAMAKDIPNQVEESAL